MNEENPTIEVIVNSIISYARELAGKDMIAKINSVMSLVNLSISAKMATATRLKAHGGDLNRFWEIRGNWGRIDTFRKEHTRK
jgi:hypothetical protein